MDDIKYILKDSLISVLKSDVNSAKQSFSLLLSYLKFLISQNPPFVFNTKESSIQSSLITFPPLLDCLYLMGYLPDDSNNDIFIYQNNSIENIETVIQLLSELLEATPVTVFQYDLTNGLAKQFSQSFIGKSIEGVWHTSLCVYDVEYFYGGGICKGTPKKTPYGIPVKELDMGLTYLSKSDFDEFIHSINQNYNMNNYDILNHNCNHFTNEALHFLTGESLPDAILKQHEELLATPLGQLIKPYLENISQQNNTFLPNMFEGK